MNKIKTLLLAILLSISSMGYVSAQGSDLLDAENFSATLTFTTDYAFRGTSFSEFDPAIQGSFDWSYGPWFAGAWGSSTKPENSGSTFEIDYYFGWSDTVAGLDVTISPLLYTFPGQGGTIDDTTFELWTSWGYGFADFPGAPYVQLDVNWSPRYFNDGDSALYWKPSIAFSLPNGFGLDIAYGYQDVGGLNTFVPAIPALPEIPPIPGIGFPGSPAMPAVPASGNVPNEIFFDDYSHWEIGITKSLLGFDLDLRYHDNQDVEVLGNGFALDSEVVFSIARSF